MTSECVKVVSHSQIKVEEHGKKAIFDNPDRLPHVVGKVDRCLIVEGIRADSLVASSELAVLVELKGTDVSHACDQLFSAAKHPNLAELLRGRRIGFLIVCSRYPRFDTKIQKAKDRAQKEFGAGFKVQTSQITTTLASICSIKSDCT